MRYESSVISLSWIPSEAIRGMSKSAFEMGPLHYDDPPPESLAGPEEIEALRAADRFRFGNELRGWVDVEDGRIVGHGQSGGCHIGVTKLKLGRTFNVAAVAMPELRLEPEVGLGWVRFTQTAGGRTGVPMPRPVPRAPFFRVEAPLVWTTLSLTVHADGSAEHSVVGASPFPRHWIYNAAGNLSHKSGLLEMKDWARHAFGKATPWGAEDSPAVVTEVETALERELSATIMRGGAKPKIRKLKEGRTLVEQGQPGSELYLLLDGVLSVEVDERPVAEVGPGVVLGERAILEGGARTSTLRAVTDCRVAVAEADAIDRTALAELSEGHRREDPSV
ncbi:MAG: cyclic nucleotide-binding domain-containing protein [Actinobacteria bacterium]|nr:cyclic nucleotide-binding domain-containing protein [Actinomycetota bacterium]